MRIEEMRTFPVSAKEAFDYVTDPRTVVLWVAGVIDVYDADEATWGDVGDRLRFAYRLLGRRVDVEMMIIEDQPGEFRKIHTEVPGVGTVTQEWFFIDRDHDRVTLRVVWETSDSTSFFGKVIDRTVVPRTLARNLKATMSNLEDVFSLGFSSP